MRENRKIFFVSDLHLGNSYIQTPVETEKKLTHWLESIKTEATAIYFLGDVFDYWYEYKYIVPKGHVRFLGKIAELADAGIEIHMFIGNHDIWMFDYLQQEIGAIIHREPMTQTFSGKNFFLGHGDEVGHRPWQYRLIQTVFRNKICQILYSSLHPRWTFAFARRWSAASRKKGMQTERFLQAQQKNLHALETFAQEYITKSLHIDFFIFGHLHILYDKQLTPSTRLVIIGDWISHFSYAVWNGKELTLHQIDNK